MHKQKTQKMILQKRGQGCDMKTPEDETIPLERRPLKLVMDITDNFRTGCVYCVDNHGYMNMLDPSNLASNNCIKVRLSYLNSLGPFNNK